MAPLTKPWAFAIVLCFGFAFSTHTKMEWTDCGAGLPNQAITVSRLDVTPMPVIIPGSLVVNLEGQALRPLDNIFINATISRSVGPSWFSFDLDLPCFGKVGSCDYDLCQATLNFKFDQGCPKSFIDNNLPCVCPVPKMVATMTNQTFKIGKLPDLLDWIKDGDYTVKGVVREGQNSTETIGCLEMKFSLASPPEPQEVKDALGSFFG